MRAVGILPVELTSDDLKGWMRSQQNGKCWKAELCDAAGRGLAELASPIPTVGIGRTKTLINKIARKTKGLPSEFYNLGFLPFITSALSASSAVRSSVAMQPR
jgi:hypothetical protein